MLSPINTRRSRRHQVDLPVRVIVRSGVFSMVVPGRGTEISERGMALYAGIQKEPGELIDVEFHTGNRRATGRIRSRSGYCYGLEFVTPLTNYASLGAESRRQYDLKLLADQVQKLAVKSLPLKKKFFGLVRKQTPTMDGYIERCAELELAMRRYEPALREMQSLVSEVVEALKNDAVSRATFVTIEDLLEKNLRSLGYVKEELGYAKQLANLAGTDQVKLYEQRIHPLREAGARLAAEGIDVVNAAKARGVRLPAEMYRDVAELSSGS
ncbi:MAG TPA: PilZ domain-containing protein [Terriglobales bacterium]|nr:PilZ domain-containing protein [Terriglobales bacterium]